MDTPKPTTQITLQEVAHAIAQYLLQSGYAVIVDTGFTDGAMVRAVQHNRPSRHPERQYSSPSLAAAWFCIHDRCIAVCYDAKTATATVLDHHDLLCITVHIHDPDALDTILQHVTAANAGLHLANSILHKWQRVTDDQAEMAHGR